jgi:hypothetical protein
MNTTEAAAKSSQARNIEIANTILAQLGGRRAVAMLGATRPGDLAAAERELVLRFRGSRKANILKIRLDADDTYTLRLVKYTNGRWSDKRGEFTPTREKLVFEASGLYVENLRPVIETETGLFLSL